MLKKLFLVLAVIIAGIIIVSRFQPDSYTVERSATIAVPPALVFEHVNNFKKWQQFNAWGDTDPNAVYTYNDTESGVGANFHWKGNSDMGEGNMTILESKPNEYVKVDLAFIEPFEGKAIAEFLLEPTEGGTKLTERTSSDHNFFSKIMCMFMDMDKMIGQKYEEGFRRMNKILPGMKQATEAPVTVPPDSTAASL
ncbi:MAG: SRPBCC family protein [Flavobacteriales bacterium]|nr:SRPBCC family protein [Flavobacteriales bacterium]